MTIEDRHKGTGMKKIKKLFTRSDRGSVVIEATLSLSFFMFFIMILLTTVNMCIAQSKIGVALNESAKEFSEYSYIYSLTGVNDLQKENYEKVEGTITDINSAISGLEDAKKAFDTVAVITESDTPWEDLSSAKDSVDSAADKYNTIYKNFVANPGGYILGLGRVVANEGAECFKGEVVGAIVKGLMYKHLKASSEDDVDYYLRKHRVVDGIDGLNLSNSSIYTNGSDDITFVCIYKLEIMRLLNVDFSYDICQMAKTKAWTGNSLVRKASDDADGGSSAEDPSDGDGVVSDGDAGDTEDPEDNSGLSDREKAYAEMRKKMEEKYSKEIVDAIIKEYGEDAAHHDGIEKWTEENWDYAVMLYYRDHKEPELSKEQQAWLDELNSSNNDEELKKELKESGAKHSKKNTVFITKTPDGKLLWLETGNSNAGLKHILKRHGADFNKRGIKTSEIPKLLKEVLSETPIETGEKGKGPYAVYEYNDQRYNVAYGENGFIVSFYPISK